MIHPQRQKVKRIIVIIHKGRRKREERKMEPINHNKETKEEKE